MTNAGINLSETIFFVKNYETINYARYKFLINLFKKPLTLVNRLGRQIKSENKSEDLFVTKKN